MIVAERGSGRMTYAKKKKNFEPFAEHDLRVTLQRAGNNWQWHLPSLLFHCIKARKDSKLPIHV